MPKYMVVFGSDDEDTWLTEASSVDAVIKEYNDNDIGGGEPITHIFEMIDVTPKDIPSAIEDPKLPTIDGLPSWWMK